MTGINIYDSLIVAEQDILLKPLRQIISDYLVKAAGCDHAAHYMLAIRDEPEIFVRVAEVVEELDESIRINYSTGPEDPWPRLNIFDRLSELTRRKFVTTIKVEETFERTFSFAEIIENLTSGYSDQWREDGNKINVKLVYKLLHSWHLFSNMFLLNRDRTIAHI